MLFFITEYSNHLNTEHQNTRFMWILDSMGVRYSNGKVMWLGGPFENRTFWTINGLFSVRCSGYYSNTRPFDKHTQIYHSNTRLVWHSDGYCRRQTCVNSLIIPQDTNSNVQFRIIMHVWQTWANNSTGNLYSSKTHRLALILYNFTKLYEKLIYFEKLYKLFGFACKILNFTIWGW